MESDGNFGSRYGARDRLPQTKKLKASADRKTSRFLTNTRRKVIAIRNRRASREKHVPHRQAEERPAISENRGITRGRDMAVSYHQKRQFSKLFFIFQSET
jgi:hypothetical protein